MNTLLDLYAHEPAMVISGTAALVTAVLVLVTSFGVPVTDEQRAAINALLVVVITVGMGIAIRSRVTPVGTLEPAPIPISTVITPPVVPPAA